MIAYKTGGWGFAVLPRWRGSVFPRAIVIGLPSALLCFIFGILQDHFIWAKNLKDMMDGLTTVWAGYSTILGFFLCFHHGQSYGRFTQGFTNLAQMRGEWYDAAAALFAYCSKSPEKKRDVNYFQYTLLRLTSLLNCVALQEICELNDDALETIAFDNIDTASWSTLCEAKDRCQCVMQWIRKLIVDASQSGIVDAPAPLVCPAIKSFSKGMVVLSECRNITDIPFPFPYIQTLLGMLMIHWVITPLIAASVMNNQIWAAILVFLVVTSFWSLHYIAGELEQPFGDDDNDLPIREMQKDFNRSLLVLLHDNAERVPTFEVDHAHLPGVSLGASNNVLLGRTGAMAGQPSPKDKHHNRYEDVDEAVKDLTKSKH